MHSQLNYFNAKVAEDLGDLRGGLVRLDVVCLLAELLRRLGVKPATGQQDSPLRLGLSNGALVLAIRCCPQCRAKGKLAVLS